MLQTWILRRDVNPFAAIHNGADASICGDCPLRGIIDKSNRRRVNRRRACYVSVHQAPLAVLNAYTDHVALQIPRLAPVTTGMGFVAVTTCVELQR